MKVTEGRTRGQTEEERGQTEEEDGRTDVPVWRTQRESIMYHALTRLLEHLVVVYRDPLTSDKEGGEDLPSSGGKTRISRGGCGVTT